MKDTERGSRPFKVFLVGFMGSGKTTVGKLLAEELKCPFFDLDEEIERRTGLSITNIFAIKGEDFFRSVEKSLLEEFLAKDENFVLSCGGGVIEDSDNRKKLFQSGIVIWLNISWKEFLKKRLPIIKSTRPLLKLPLKDIMNLYKRRLSFYQEVSHLTLKVNGKDPNELVKEIVCFLNLR